MCCEFGAIFTAFKMTYIFNIFYSEVSVECDTDAYQSAITYQSQDLRLTSLDYIHVGFARLLSDKRDLLPLNQFGFLTVISAC